MTIVCGYTDRPESQAALRWGVREAQLRGLPLHVRRTFPEQPTDSPGQVHDWQVRVEQARADGERILQQLRDAGVEGSYDLIVSPADSTASELLAAASALGAELLVIGLRRRSPVGKLVLGSVSQRVLLGADCPVLTVKADD